jgi:hypothetical protein
VATVTDLIFQGAGQRYELVTATGRRITAITPVQSLAERSAPGDRVFVTWKETVAHLVLEAAPTGEDVTDNSEADR